MTQIKILNEKIKNLERELKDITQNKEIMIRLAKEEEKERIIQKLLKTFKNDSQNDRIRKILNSAL